MECDDLVKYLSDYIDNNLSEEFTDAAKAHLATCENCRVVLNSTQQMIVLYREHGKTQRIPKERQQTLYENLERAFAARNPELD